MSENFDDRYSVKRIDTKTAKEYIKLHHYSHGCSNGPSPCYGLYEQDNLIGCLMFATPCSENVRASIWGGEHKDAVVELHRLHILDCTPKNTESWFISRCLKMLKTDRPQTRGVISFADETEGHKGIVYQATNFYQIGKTGKATFFIDADGRLRHPRQNGHNVTPEEAKEYGWMPVKRESKNRYLYILAPTKIERKRLMKSCNYNLSERGNDEQ